MPVPLNVELTALTVGLVQMTSAKQWADNIAVVTDAAAKAAGQGCQLLCLPEVAGMMNREAIASGTALQPPAQDPFIHACQGLAQSHRLWIQAGSTPVLGIDGRARNHAVLISDQGDIVARYDKIHLFDIQLDGQAPTGESDRYGAGAQAVLAKTPWGPWGLSICYDVRFPALYRAYAQAGARLLFVPSAFTVPTGRAHWEVLLRARAIENGAWVIAAAQVGKHEDGRKTWGHGMVISPWGDVVLDQGDAGPTTDLVQIDLTLADAARRQLPSLSHDRSFGLIGA